MHRQQPQFLRGAWKQPQLDATAHVIGERQIGEVGSTGKWQAAANREAIVLHRDATREAELIVGEHQPRGLGAVHFLQRDDVGIQSAGVPAQRGDVFAAARELMRDIAGHGTPRAIARRVRRRAGGCQRAQRFRRHEPFEIPGGDLEFGGSGVREGCERQQHGDGSALFHARDYRMRAGRCC